MNRYKDWLEQGERDIKRAMLDIQFEYYEWACFTSQQSAEKVVKALCLRIGIDVWGHSITTILKLLKGKIKVSDDVIESAQLLDTFYIPARYPNGFSIGKPADYYNKGMAEEALGAADKILKFCKDNIDKQAGASSGT